MVMFLFLNSASDFLIASENSGLSIQTVNVSYEISASKHASVLLLPFLKRSEISPVFSAPYFMNQPRTVPMMTLAFLVGEVRLSVRETLGSYSWWEPFLRVTM